MKLDIYQEEIVKSTAQHIVVISGAGSGKTLTIMGKIYYLIKYKKKFLIIVFNIRNLKRKFELI